MSQPLSLSMDFVAKWTPKARGVRCDVYALGHAIKGTGRSDKANGEAAKWESLARALTDAGRLVAQGEN